MRVLLAGAHGRLGGRTLALLLNCGHAVRALVRNEKPGGRAARARGRDRGRRLARGRRMRSGRYRSSSIVCHVLAGPAPGLVEHFYTTDEQERDRAAANDGYLLDGVACWVLPVDAGVADAVPLFRLFSPAGDHFYTINEAERDDAVQRLGFREESMACRVFARARAGTSPLHRFIDDAGDHFYTVSPNDDPALTRNKYRPEGIACHVFAREQPRSIPFHRLYKAARAPVWRLQDARGRTYLTGTPQERDRAEAHFGYSLVDEAFHGFADERADGAVPLWRLGNRTHRYTTSSEIRDGEVRSGAYDAQGILCHVPEAAIPGSVPLFELLSATINLPVP